jgi:transposase InsO family protein
MKIHKNARLTLKGRHHLVADVLKAKMPLKEAATKYRVSEKTAGKWARRFSMEGAAGLVDRSSRPHVSPRRLPARIVKKIERLRRLRLTAIRIAAEVGCSRASVSRVLKRLGLSRLSDLDPEGPVFRYERATPGEILPIDAKRLARIVKIGHRATGNRQDSSPGAGYETVFVAVDDHSRLAFVELKSAETKEQAAAFLGAAAAYYQRLGVKLKGVMTDNGPAFCSRAFAKATRTLALKHLKTQPYTPKTNGKAERFIQSALREWAYGFVYHTSHERARMLGHWLHHYNWHRPHSGIGGAPPISRLSLNMNNLVRLHN